MFDLRQYVAASRSRLDWLEMEFQLETLYRTFTVQPVNLYSIETGWVHFVDRTANQTNILSGSFNLNVGLRSLNLNRARRTSVGRLQDYLIIVLRRLSRRSLTASAGSSAV
jgi:Mg2+ and Co2+ transporter CorA